MATNISTNYDTCPTRDLTFRKGQTWQETWRFKNTTTLEYLSFTGLDIRMQVRSSSSSSKILKELYMGAGFTIDPNDNTKLNVKTDMLYDGKRTDVYDVRIIYTDVAYTDFLMKGKCDLVDAVTETP